MWALTMLDLKQLLSSPAVVGTAILPPIGMAMLLAVLSLTVLEQPVALVVESHGPYAARMEKLIRSDEEAYILTVTDSVTASRLLRDQEVAAVITIPADFDREASDHDAVLQLKLNNIDIDFADDIRRSVDQAVGQFDAPSLGLHDKLDKSNEEVGNSKAVSGIESDSDESEEQSSGPYEYYVEPGTNAYHIDVQEHDLRITNVDFLHYQLIPVLVLLVLNVGMTGTALLCVADVERGTARLLILAPISSWALVAGRMLGGFLASLAVLTPVLWVCIAVRAIVVPDNHWAAVIALFIVVALCAAAMGAGLGTVLRGRRNVAMASSIAATYLFFMGGGFTTIAFLPQWLRAISAFNPMRYAIDGLREALFYPTLTGFSADIAILTAASVIAMFIASVMVVHSWRR